MYVKSVSALFMLGLCLPLMLWAEPRVIVSSAADNDLVQVLTDAGYDYKRVDSPAAAVAQAPEGGAVLILARGYPEVATQVDGALFADADARNLRLYVEYPAWLPGVTVGSRISPTYDRAVIKSNFFGDSLQPMRILAVHGLNYLPVNAAEAHMVSARVAGFDTAVFGLADTPTAPLLFELPGSSVLVATSKLSQFVTARYAPKDAWQAVWEGIMEWLLPGQDLPELGWTPSVRTSYGPHEELPRDVERQAIRRGSEWFQRSKLLLHPEREAEVLAEIARSPGSPRLPTPPPDAPVGDGSLGILEAPLSEILPDGSQIQSVIRRGDCHGESAMALALASAVEGAESHTNIARNLLDFYLFESEARKGGWGDPKHGGYGLSAWGIDSPSWHTATYGDDNARLLMSAAATAAVLGVDRWDEAMMKCLLANLRTTGPRGYRPRRINMPALAGGWERFFKSDKIHYSPHFQSWIWACYLWAYERTGFELFYERAVSGLRIMMSRYPDGLEWTNGLAQERARILLPLAWLVRVKDTPEHRAWLKTAVDGLLALQVESGAIREELGNRRLGRYPQPGSNRAYGTTEAPLIQQNGDPVADMLYTVNFAFLALHEAAAATGDPEIRAAEDKLAEFLCRIQIRSEAQPSLDGGWFRVFDFKRWEAWGSNADHGWGAWAIESGWTQGWIVAVMAMRQMDVSLWELVNKSDIAEHFEDLRQEMLPDDVIQSVTPATVDHAAVGCPVRLATPPDGRYAGSGAEGLVDGRLEPANYRAPGWLGFEGGDFVATIDLGRSMAIDVLEFSFLYSPSVGIYPPVRVDFSVSNDGEDFQAAAALHSKVDLSESGARRVRLASECSDGLRARYVRVRAKNHGELPDNHKSSGKPAWLFMDELIVNPE